MTNATPKAKLNAVVRFVQNHMGDYVLDTKRHPHRDAAYITFTTSQDDAKFNGISIRIVQGQFQISIDGRMSADNHEIKYTGNADALNAMLAALL